jgi:hypothetical protein
MWGSRRPRRPEGGEALVDELDAASQTASARRRLRRPPRAGTNDGRLLNPSVDLVGTVVTQLRFDYGVTIALGDDVSLRIETPFELTAADAEPVLLDPERDLGRMGSLLLLHRTAVTAFSADTSGDLEVAFSDGSAVRCRPDERFEAWKLSFADGRLYVCLPGGDVSVWAGGGDLWADGDD